MDIKDMSIEQITLHLRDLGYTIVPMGELRSLKDELSNLRCEKSWEAENKWREAVKNDTGWH